MKDGRGEEMKINVLLLYILKHNIWVELNFLSFQEVDFVPNSEAVKP